MCSEDWQGQFRSWSPVNYYCISVWICIKNENTGILSAEKKIAMTIKVSKLLSKKIKNKLPLSEECYLCQY